MIPSAVSSFFHTFVIFYFRHLCTCFNVSVKHSRWNIQTDGTKASETFFSPCFCGFCVSILLHVQGLRNPNSKTKLLWINADTQCCCARCDLLHLLQRGVSKNCEKQQPTNHHHPPPSASHTCHSDRQRHECEFEPPSPPLSSSSILMEIASLNKHSGQETGDTHGTVCLAIVTNQAAAWLLSEGENSSLQGPLSTRGAPLIWGRRAQDSC